MPYRVRRSVSTMLLPDQMRGGVDQAGSRVGRPRAKGQVGAFRAVGVEVVVVPAAGRVQVEGVADRRAERCSVPRDHEVRVDDSKDVFGHGAGTTEEEKVSSPGSAPMHGQQ